MLADHVIPKEVHDMQQIFNVDGLLVGAGEDGLSDGGHVGNPLRRRKLEDLGTEAGIDAPVVAYELDGGKMRVQVAGLPVWTEDVGCDVSAVQEPLDGYDVFRCRLAVFAWPVQSWVGFCEAT